MKNIHENTNGNRNRNNDHANAGLICNDMNRVNKINNNVNTHHMNVNDNHNRNIFDIRSM